MSSHNHQPPFTEKEKQDIRESCLHLMDTLEQYKQRQHEEWIERSNRIQKIDMQCDNSESYCHHHVTILKDGKNTTTLYSAPEIAEMIERWNPSIDDETFRHFRRYFTTDWLRANNLYGKFYKG